MALASKREIQAAYWWRNMLSTARGIDHKVATWDFHSNRTRELDADCCVSA